MKSARKLNIIKYKDTKVKQLSWVAYLGSVLHETLSGEPMVLKSIEQDKRETKIYVPWK